MDIKKKSQAHGNSELKPESGEKLDKNKRAFPYDSNGLKAKRPGIDDGKPRGKGSAVRTIETTAALPAVTKPSQKYGVDVGRPTSEIIDGRYKIRDVIEQGATGTVFDVEHFQLKTRFVMRIFHDHLSKNKSSMAQLHLEALELSRMNHPNCVGITDFGETSDGNFYTVVERVEGQSIQDILKDGPLPMGEAIEITRQVLLGLECAHKAGIVHRNIKLKNLIKTENEHGGFTIKIVDFNLAGGQMSGEGGKAPLEAGAVLGTPQYVAPETFFNKTMNEQTDLYALGVTLFRMLTAKALWNGHDGDTGDILKAKLKNPTPRLNETSSGVFPKSLEEFLVRALEDPKIRFANATEMRKAIEEVAKEIDVSRSPIETIPGSTGMRSPAMDSDHRKKEDSTKSQLRNLMRPRVRADFGSWAKASPNEGGKSLLGKGRSGYNASSKKRGSGIALVPIVFAVLITAIWAVGDYVFGPNDAADKEDVVSVSVKNVAPSPELASADAFDESQAEYAKKASKLLQQKKCGEAKRYLKTVVEDNPSSAHAHFLLGRAHMCLGSSGQGLSSYGTAIKLSDEYRSSSEILKDTKKLVNKPKIGLEALHFMTEELGENALPVLVDIAGEHRNKKMRHSALDYVSDMGALPQVKQEKSLALDLKQAESCDEKAEIVDKLADLGTHDAKKELKRAKNAARQRYFGGKYYVNGCVRERIERRLAEMPKDPSNIS